MADTKRKTLRFYLDNPTHRKAWDYLQNLDKSQFKSFNDMVAIAVADYFENREREERFIKKIAEHVLQACTRPNPHIISVSSSVTGVSMPSVEEDVSEYIDFDFIGG